MNESANGAQYDSQGREARRARAPTARNMIARGKREARRPWFAITASRRGLKGRNMTARGKRQASEARRPWVKRKGREALKEGNN